MLNSRRSIAPVPNTAVTQVDRICDRDHFVQFYNNDDILIESIARYFAVGFSKGDVAVLIATPEHRRSVESRLDDMGFDVEALRDSADYSPFDARDMLDHFMIRGMPDPRRFRALLGTWMDAAMGEVTGIRAFGEMVALLHQDGNERAAIELERLWNELGIIYEFTLFCAYPSRQFLGGAKTDGLSRICAAHSRVISSAP